jgi:hypothetical protein
LHFSRIANLLQVQEIDNRRGCRAVPGGADAGLGVWYAAQTSQVKASRAVQAKASRAVLMQVWAVQNKVCRLDKFSSKAHRARQRSCRQKLINQQI